MKDGQLNFLGKVKRPNKFKANPMVDHIMENMAASDDQHPQEQRKVETAGMVTLRVPSDPHDPQGNRPLDINLNGQNFRLQRDVTATVPKEIADIVLNSQKSVSDQPAAVGEKVVCQVDPSTGTYVPGKAPKPVETRRFNVIVEDVEE